MDATEKGNEQLERVLQTDPFLHMALEYGRPRPVV